MCFGVNAPGSAGPAFVITSDTAAGIYFVNMTCTVISPSGTGSYPVDITGKIARKNVGSGLATIDESKVITRLDDASHISSLHLTGVVDTSDSTNSDPVSVHLWLARSDALQDVRVEDFSITARKLG